MKYFSVRKKILLVSLMTFIMCGCSEVKQTDIQAENKPDIPQESSQQTDENKEDIIITLATNSAAYSELQDEIDSFNALDNGYQVVTKIVDMDFYNEEEGLAVMNDEDSLTVDFNLTQDIMNTDSIDIIPSYAFANQSKYEILRKMGAFADLYPFMENDPEVNTSTLNQHILSLNETDGRLCSLPMFYYAITLAGETKYVGDKENWTVDDFISCWENMPEGSTVNGVRNSENIYRGILSGNLETFVDYENAEVNFDCPEFRKILEFCSRFEYTNRKGEWDYESPIMVSPRYLSGIMSADLFRENSETNMIDFRPPYTMVGYPSPDGQGAFFNSGVLYSISAKSSPEKQKGAWEFIRQFYTEEYQQENVIEKEIINYDGEEITQFSAEKGFCINNNAFENVAQKIMNGEYYDGKYSVEGVEYTNPLPTQEEIDKLVKYLDSINRWETTIDRQLWNIIDEEIMAYLAGEKSLDDTVDMIQNRASILVSEQS